MDRGLHFCHHGRAMAVNPFEPPPGASLQTTVEPQGRTLSEAALGQLHETAAPALWTARFALVSLVLTALNGIVGLARGNAAAGPIDVVVSLALTLALGFFFLSRYRRYAWYARRMTTGEPGAMSIVLATQRSIFKGFGVIAILLMGTMVAGIVWGIINHRLRRG